ncbi:secondary thiamine-phosphate synthase enzyme YjbQ [Desulfofalx alkaliphila]|uniref:secondary thiamine-phosphate synthase enzyme YjbQ n=1 Tax=Desulfofalx alkaliphila TaxID=105483 RepID=UPI0004E120E8|nr:secondary thiamine-phosphate synthase enzyme YjbQ [Desulfofalx alkaliphila]
MTRNYIFRVKTHQRTEMVDLTKEILKLLQQSKVTDGICYIFIPHTTAGVTINENADPTVVTDMLGALNKLVPVHNNYLHSEGNSDAHIKATLVGASETVLITDGTLQLGTWQGIYLCEFDGPRNRKVMVKIHKT